MSILRRRPPLLEGGSRPPRGPLGAPRGASGAHSQHPLPDAPPGRQRRGLHELPGQRGQGVRAGPFESGLKASAGDVYVHEIPGGQYSNLRPRAEAVRRIKADPDNLHHLGSPMAGMVVEAHARSGAKVEEGDKLIVLEAMKTEMILASPLSGVVKEVYVKNGDRVDGGDLMVVFQ